MSGFTVFNIFYTISSYTEICNNRYRYLITTSCCSITVSALRNMWNERHGSFRENKQRFLKIDDLCQEA